MLHRTRWLAAVVVAIHRAVNVAVYQAAVAGVFGGVAFYVVTQYVVPAVLAYVELRIMFPG